MQGHNAEKKYEWTQEWMNEWMRLKERKKERMNEGMKEWKKVCSLKFATYTIVYASETTVFFFFFGRKGEHWNKIMLLLFWLSIMCRVHIATISDPAFIAATNYMLKCKLNWATMFLHCHSALHCPLIVLCNSNWYAWGPLLGNFYGQNLMLNGIAGFSFILTEFLRIAGSDVLKHY